MYAEAIKATTKLIFMNKGLRNEIERRKFRKRIEQVGLKMEDVHKPQNNLWGYKTSGKPCSCFMCSGLKYDRANEKRNNSYNN